MLRPPARRGYHRRAAAGWRRRLTRTLPATGPQGDALLAADRTVDAGWGTVPFFNGLPMQKEHLDALRSSLGVKASPKPSKEKPEQSLADYVTIALSPVLIMALVGSLVFFLLEIVYVGQYSERLQWELFFFVFGMVLISRIAIEQGSEKAGIYGIGLGIVVFLALQAFIEYPPGTPTASFGWLINLVLMVIIWWCTNKLVWDCTYIDDKVDASGKGVLEAAGLDDTGGDAEGSAPEEEPAGNNHLPATVAWW